MHNILIIDDRADIQLSLRMLLEENGYSVHLADSPASARSEIQSKPISLVLLDMNFSLDTTSGEEGISFLGWLQTSPYNIATIAMTAWSNTDLVVKAMNLGANDFIEKPWKNKQLLHAVQQQLSISELQNQNNKLKQQLSLGQQRNVEKYQWRSSCMLELFNDIDSIAKTEVNILLRGDNGTGKSELACFIHNHSLRKNNNLVQVNMGAIVDTLFESEMFGHKKGAFTDAKNNRIGRFEMAETGTLFLDEISNIPLAQQAKLLRVLEAGEYEVLGSSQTLHTNSRLICATNTDIKQLIREDFFREDLYFRINTIELILPPLSERLDDIVPLAEYFITKFTTKYQREEMMLSSDAKNTLKNYDWPGNIREMSHLIERSVLLHTGVRIKSTDLGLSNRQNSFEDSLPLMTLREAEIKLIRAVLVETQDNIPKAAKILGLTKASMYRRLEKYALQKH